MKRILYSSLAIGGLVLLSGCNGKMGQFKSEYFNTNPNPAGIESCAFDRSGYRYR